MQIFSTITRRVAAAPLDATAWAVLAALGVVALLTFGDYGLAWDDYSHGRYGEYLLAYYTSGFTDMRAFDLYNLHFYGGGFDLVAAIFDKIMPFDLFVTRRLTGALVGLAGLFVVWRTARRLGGPVAGLAALVLLAATPLYYGHMFINAKDTPFAVAMAFLAYATVRNFEEYPRPRIPTILLFGLALGLAVGTRVIGGIGLVFAAAGVTVLFAIDWRELGAKTAAWRVATFAVSLALALPLAYVVMGIDLAVVGAGAAQPAARHRISTRTSGRSPGRTCSRARAILIPDMPRTYVPQLCLLKLPEIFVALALAGTAGGSVVVLRGGIEPWRRASLALLISAAMLPILIAVVTRPVLYNGIRHFLFVIPPFAVLGGLAAAYLLERLRDYARPAVAAGIVAFFGLLSVTMVDFWRIHPYQYALFNHIAGGVRGAQSQYMLDYWGLGLKEASENLLTHLDEMDVEPPRNRKWKVAVCGPAHTVGFELGPSFEATGDPKGADFAISLGTYYCAKLNAPILATAEREGVVFARAYDLRGRTIVSTYIAPDDEKKASDTPSNFGGVF